jgi:hypothetical protein
VNTESDRIQTKVFAFHFLLKLTIYCEPVFRVKNDTQTTVITASFKLKNEFFYYLKIQLALIYIIHV